MWQCCVSRTAKIYTICSTNPYFVRSLFLIPWYNIYDLSNNVSIYHRSATSWTQTSAYSRNRGRSSSAAARAAATGDSGSACARAAGTAARATAAATTNARTTNERLHRNTWRMREHLSGRGNCVSNYTVARPGHNGSTLTLYKLGFRAIIVDT